MLFEVFVLSGSMGVFPVYSWAHDGVFFVFSDLPLSR